MSQATGAPALPQVSSDPVSRLFAFLSGPTHALLRVGAGLLFMEHGLMKLFGMFADPSQPPMAGPHAFSLMWVAGVLETFGGPLLALGLGVRPVALLLCGEMIVAYGMVHSHMGTWPIENHGELALLYLIVFAFLMGNGAGPFSLDGILFGRKKARD